VDTPVTSHTCATLLKLLTRKSPPLVVWNCHSWAVLPLQVNCCTAVPFAVPAARASTHLPLPVSTTVYQVLATTAALAGVVDNSARQVAATVTTAAASANASLRR
jgi:hypothetical protein